MATVQQQSGVTEAQIAVHWREEEYYYPSPKFIGQANLNDPSINERFSEKNFPECFREYADLLSWDQYWHTTLDTSDPPFWKWFVGGKINASYNCIDRHLAKHKNKAAITFVPEPESEAPVYVTYRELYVRVNEFAAEIASPFTCQWSPSCRSPCWPAPAWEWSTRWCSEASAAKLAGCVPPIPAARS